MCFLLGISDRLYNRKFEKGLKALSEQHEIKQENAQLESSAANIADAPSEPESKKQKFRRSVLEWTDYIVTSAIIIAVITTFAVRLVGVSGTSMVPNYHHGDRLISTQWVKDYDTGDVVIVANALEDPIIKRVIATEGQTVDFDPVLKEVTVDGVPLFGETFGIENGITDVPDFGAEVMMQFPQTVPENCVFVLGDNRVNSKDSRFKVVGMVDKRNILGKAILNLYPFSLVNTGDL